MLDFFIVDDDGGVVSITVNGDDADGNENYTYWEVGKETPEADEDEIVLFETTTPGSADMGATVEIYARGDDNGRIGFGVTSQAGRSERIESFATGAGYNQSDGLQSVLLEVSGGVQSFDREYVRLYEVIR